VALIVCSTIFGILFILTSSALALPFDLSVNGDKGTVFVEKDTPVIFTVVSSPNMSVTIDNDDDNIVLCNGITDQSGSYECKVTFSQNKSFILQGYADFKYGHYTMFSNPITLVIGTPQGISRHDAIAIIFMFCTVLLLFYLLLRYK
jgi:hypothetical protein